MIDNAVEAPAFARIQRIILEEVPWLWCRTEGPAGATPLHGYSFYHMPWERGQAQTNFGLELAQVIETTLRRQGIEIQELQRIRLGLIPHSTIAHQHPAHVDYPVEHWTGLLYINDSDGATYLYQERWQPEWGSDFVTYAHGREFTLEETVEPRANRLVLFPGLQFHSSSTPQLHPRRVAMNFNFRAK